MISTKQKKLGLFLEDEAINFIKAIPYLDAGVSRALKRSGGGDDDKDKVKMIKDSLELLIKPLYTEEIYTNAQGALEAFAKEMIG